MLVFADGTSIGTVGGGELEARIIRESTHVFVENVPKFMEVDLTPMDRDNLGMVCGGRAKIYIEPVVPRQRAVIFGGRPCRNRHCSHRRNRGVSSDCS